MRKVSIKRKKIKTTTGYTQITDPMTPKNTHGGSRGGGRPQKPEGEKKGKNVTFRPSAQVAEILSKQENRTKFIEEAILFYQKLKSSGRV